MGQSSIKLDCKLQQSNSPILMECWYISLDAICLYHEETKKVIDNWDLIKSLAISSDDFNQCWKCCKSWQDSIGPYK